MKLRPEQVATLAAATSGRHLVSLLRESGRDANFEPAANAVAVREAEGATVRLRLDTEGRVSEVVSPLGRSTTFAFGATRTDITTPAGRRTAIRVDEQRRPQAIRTPGGGIARCAYGPSGHLRAMRFADETVLRIEHGDEGRVSGLIDRLGRRTSYTQDEFGRLTEVRDTSDRVTRLSYGVWDRPVRVQWPGGATDAYEYGPDGRLSSLRRSGRAFVTLTHTGDQLTGLTFADGTSHSYEYDAGGRVVDASLDGCRVLREFDAQGRLSVERQDDWTVEYRHHENGALSSLTFPDGLMVRYAYDDDGRLTELSDTAGRIQRFSYGADDEPIQRTLPNGLAEQMSYDAHGLPAGATVQADGRTVWSWSADRDVMGRIVTHTDARHGPSRFRYDAEGRLLAKKDGTRVTLRRFDAFDNAAGRADAASFAGDQVRAFRGRAFEYDADGNRTTAGVGSDQTVYGYRAAHTLSWCGLADGSRVEFRYDAFGRRILKRTANGTTRYGWANQQMVCERYEDAMGAVVRSRVYVYRPGTHVPLAFVENGESFFYHVDHLGTPQLVTDGRGAIVWSARYTLTGGARIEIEQVENSLRLPGQYFDRETGLHYNRARYYDPETGTYLSPDPAGLLAGTHRYAYCSGDPINGADPLGLFGETWPGWVKTGVSIAAGVGAAVAVVAAAPVVLAAAGIAATGTLAAGLTIAAAGMAAGAVGMGINAAMTEGGCVACEMLRGAGIGALASLPFLAGLAWPVFAAAAGVMGTGGLSGGIGYLADWAGSSEPFSPLALAGAMAFGMATAGIGQIVAGRIRARKVGTVLDDMYKRAPAAKEEIDQLAKGIADNVNGRVSEAPLKGRERALQKAMNDYGSDATRIKDLARNTIVVDEAGQAKAAQLLKDSGAQVRSTEAATDPLGYSDTKAIVQTKAGIRAEIQVNTPEMIYAKEPPAKARAILGEESYNRVASRAGQPGGRGHELYEEWRQLPPDSPRRPVIEAESRSYYESIRRGTR